MESTELNWHEAQRRQSELTAFSQALMMLIGGVAVIAMLWLASGDVGEFTAGSSYCPFRLLRAGGV
jgi:ATP-binding cassette subfamily C protein CydC